MNEISFVFYGEPDGVQQHLLFLLGILEVRPLEEALKGFYVIEKKFGKEIYKSLSLDVRGRDEDVLLYRYLSDEEVKLVQDRSLNTRYYLLLHHLMNLDYAKDSLFLNDRRFSLVASATMSTSKIRHYAGLKELFGTKSLFFVKTAQSVSEKASSKNRRLPLPYFILFMLKVLMSPVGEVRRGLQILKFSNLRLLSRFAELIYFVSYIFNVLIYEHGLRYLGTKVFYGVLFIGGLFRVVVIKLGYLIRHLLLMSGFKSFGIFVDAYNFSLRAKDASTEILFYKTILPLYYSSRHALTKINEWSIISASFIFHHIFVYIYFNIIKKFVYYYMLRGTASFLLYKILYPLFYGFLRLQSFIRHAVLMSMFKGYGLLYDSFALLHRFTKLVLLYPFFKFYWFLSFQYKKRVKKSL